MPDEKPDVIDSEPKKGILPVLLLLIGAIAGYVVGSLTSGPDVSEGGQTSYACALAEKVRAGHQSEDDWGTINEDPAYNEMMAIRSLLGASMSAGNGEDERFADLDWSVVSEGGVEAWGTLLDEIIEAC
ncbi:hypothetical protein [Nocardioides abyssi]|uniref:Uncharacterized protein n=1 Tax=Nocardioides abyssi TaxID=3058370 RepID=A0ABT8ESU1_9ACTN|nr:hypothetical protein [Nocardioides abyssi]MDN4161103.1 hypothetical protein [Nocardioides abyssi]